MSQNTIEIGLGALSDWLHIKRGRWRAWNPWGFYGTVFGTLGGFCGAMTGVLSGLGQEDGAGRWIALLWAAYGIAAIGAAVLVARLSSKRRSRRDGTFSLDDGAMRELSEAWVYGRLRIVYGSEGAAKINEAAAVALECATVLDSPAWRDSRSDLMQQKRRQIVETLDAGVLRVAEQARHGLGGPKIERILDDMREILGEAKKIGDRREAALGASGPEDVLRQTLADLREISRAEEEWLQGRQN